MNRPVIFGNQKYSPPNAANTEPPISTLWKWATTKYVSWAWKSIGGEATMTPVIPPIVNVYRSPIIHSIGTPSLIEPRHIVAIQLKILIPVGTAIRSDMIEKNGSCTQPVVNMWCAHTAIDRLAIAITA